MYFINGAESTIQRGLTDEDKNSFSKLLDRGAVLEYLTAFNTLFASHTLRHGKDFMYTSVRKIRMKNSYII